MVSQRGFVGGNLFVPYKTKIYNNEFPVCHHLLFLPICIRYTPSPSMSLWNKEIWLASDLLCPVQISIQHVDPSKPFQSVHICVCTCILCASVLQQCQSSHYCHGGTEGCISAASHRTMDATAIRCMSITSTHVKWILHKLSSSVLPLGGPITVVRLQLLLHLQMPHLNTQRGTDACTHTQTHTHICTQTQASQIPCWESGEWLDNTDFLSKQSQPDDSCIVCMSINALKMDKTSNVQVPVYKIEVSQGASSHKA